MSPPERQHERCCIGTFEAGMIGVACYLVFVAGSMCCVCELLGGCVWVGGGDEARHRACIAATQQNCW